MKKLNRTLAALMLFAVSTNVFSTESNENSKGYNNIYFGFGGAFANIDIDETYYEASSDTLSNASASISDNVLVGGFVGYQFNPWIAVEGRGYFGASEGDLLGITVDISKRFGIYARPILPIHEYFSVYGLIGYGSTTVKALGISESESDFEYGLGMEIGKGSNIKLQVEWQFFHDKTYTYDLSDGDKSTLRIKADSVNVNLAWYFN